MLRLNSYKPIKREGSSVIAEIEVYLLPPWDLTFRRIKELQKGDRKWFSWSMFCEEDGYDKQFFAHAEFGKEKKDKLFQLLRVEVDKFLKEKEVKDYEHSAIEVSPISNEELPF